jgi:hypothetical protein
MSLETDRMHPLTGGEDCCQSSPNYHCLAQYGYQLMEAGERRKYWAEFFVYAL